MAWFIECPFCHKSVFRWFYSGHESGHTERRADGQMNEHVTLAPEKRFEGSLDGVPQAYRHAKCGVATGMPEEIIRTYLVDPLTYNDSSFCCGCSNYVNSSDLFWMETNESVMSYMSRLRSEHVRTRYGIDSSRAEITFTPEAIRQLRSIQAQVGQPSYLVLRLIQLEMDVNYKLDMIPHWDQEVDDLVRQTEMDVVVRKDQRKRLKGTIVHYNLSGRGFVIGRLYPWTY